MLHNLASQTEWAKWLYTEFHSNSLIRHNIYCALSVYLAGKKLNHC